MDFRQTRGKGGDKRRFVPGIGQSFQVYAPDAREIDAWNRFKQGRARDRIAVGILCAVVLALGVAGGYGIYKNDFGVISGVWAVCGPIVGAVVVYYFRGDGKDESE